VRSSQSRENDRVDNKRKVSKQYEPGGPKLKTCYQLASPSIGTPRQMRRPLPRSIKIKNQDINVDAMSEKAKRILSDLLIAEEEIARHAAALRFTEIAHKELSRLLESELNQG
jgi:hypothetical protein